MTTHCGAVERRDVLLVHDRRIEAARQHRVQYRRVAEWIKSYQSIEALDFDLLAGGHGSVLFKKTDVT
jgi:hypothetical protein